MRVLRRAMLTTLVLGTLLYDHAFAQVLDTSRAEESADSVVAPAADSTRAADSTQATPDSPAAGSQTLAAKPERPVLRKVPDATVTEWQAERAYAYANDPGYWQQPRDPGQNQDSWLARLLRSKLTEYFVLVLLGAILLYAIFRIVADNNLQLFYRSPKRRTATVQHDPSPIEDDLEGKFHQHLQAGEYRQAVRYLYLMSLRLLDEKGLITYHPDATNREYWRQLGEAPQGAPFRDLTVIYEKVWYGEFPLGDLVFRRVHRYFEDFYKTVPA